MPFQIVRNDITKMHVDAIVNTADSRLNPGCAVITEGYKLPARYIIHTVGTFRQGGDKGEEETIRNCYRSVFRVAMDNGIESLSIPVLASGSYGFPKGIALRIALSEIGAFLAEHDMDLFLVVSDEKSFTLSSELYGDIDAYIESLEDM